MQKKALMFKNAILRHNTDEAIRYGFVLYKKEIYWRTLLDIMIEHIHVFTPILPFVFYKSYKKMYKTKESDLEKATNMIQIVKLFSNSLKQNISLYLKYHNMDNLAKKCTDNDIRDLMMRIHNSLEKCVVCIEKDKKVDKRTTKSLFTTMYALLSVGCNTLDNKNRSDEINLFTYNHYHTHENIVSNLFHIILFHAKQVDCDKFYKAVYCLIELYKTKLMHYKEKETLIFWVILFYFTFKIDFQCPPLVYFQQSQVNRYLVSNGFKINLMNDIIAEPFLDYNTPIITNVDPTTEDQQKYRKPLPTIQEEKQLKKNFMYQFDLFNKCSSQVIIEEKDDIDDEEDKIKQSET